MAITSDLPISPISRAAFDEVDALVETGTPENLKKALSILDDIYNLADCIIKYRPCPISKKTIAIAHT